MRISTEPIYENQIIQVESLKKGKKCLACGTHEMKRGRRYCSKECRQQMDWVLSLSKGLLRTFNARYAVFFFTREHIVLDVLPVWTKGISRFTCRRTSGNKPAADLKCLILESGREWYRAVHNRNSRSYASLLILQQNHREDIDPDSIKPNTRVRPRLSKHEKEYLKILGIDTEELTCDCQALKIKSAYKRMAKLHHPDKGGDAEKFKQLNEAHQRMLLWAENPQYTSRKALKDCWSYDGCTNRWAPPL